MIMTFEQDIIKRLRQLEEENARLRSITKTKTTELAMTEGDYKGHPVLTFERRGKQFFWTKANSSGSRGVVTC